MEAKESIVRTTWFRIGPYPFSAIRVLVIAVIAIGAILRFTGLSNHGYWLDELITVNLIESGSSHIIDSALGGRPPVYVFSAYLWSQLFGTSEIATRSLTALVSSLSLILFFAIGQKLFSVRVALLSTMLMALSAFQLFHAQDIRYYSFLIFFTLLSFWFLVRILETGKLSHFALYVLASLLMFYSHGHGVFIIAAQNLFFMLTFRANRKHAVTWFLSQTVMGLLVAPMILQQLSGADEGVQNWLWPPTIYDGIRTVYRFVFGYNSQATAPFVFFGVTALILTGLIGLLRSGVHRREIEVQQFHTSIINETAQKNIQPLIMVSIWLIIPLTLPFVLSYAIGPMYLDRYVMAASPALYLTLGLVLSVSRQFLSLGLTTVIVVAMLIPGIYNYYALPQKDQWREVASLIDARAEPGDQIVLTRDDPSLKLGIDYYSQEDRESCLMQSGSPGDEPLILESLHSCIHGYDRVWVIDRRVANYASLVFEQFLQSPDASMKVSETYSFKSIGVYLIEPVAHD